MSDSNFIDNETLFLLDSYGLIYREYFAFVRRPLTDSQGRNISAVFGFFRNFAHILSKYKPTYMIHGHIHLYDMREERIGKYYETTVVNAYAHCVIEFPVKPEDSQQSQTNQKS